MKMKMKLFTIALLGLFIAATGGAFAATAPGTTTGTCKVTYSETRNQVWRIVIWTMTTSADGNVINNDAVINGTIVKAIFNPGGTAPTDDWDCTIIAPDGEDVILALGADHDTANTETVYFAGNLGGVFSTSTLVQAVDTVNDFVPWRPETFGRHVINITNAGDSKTLVVKLLIKLK